MSVVGDFKLYHAIHSQHISYIGYTQAVPVDYLLACKETEELNGVHTLEVSILCVGQAAPFADISVGNRLIACTSTASRARVDNPSDIFDDGRRDNFDWSEFIVTQVEYVKEGGIVTLHITAEDILVDLNNYLIDELRYKHAVEDEEGCAQIFKAAGLTSYIEPVTVHRHYMNVQYQSGNTYFYRCTVKDALAQLDEKRKTKSFIGVRAKSITSDKQLVFTRNLVLFDADEQRATDRLSPIILHDSSIKSIQRTSSGFTYNYVIGLGKGEQSGDGYTKRIKTDPIYTNSFGGNIENPSGKYIVFEDIEDKEQLRVATVLRAHDYSVHDSNYKIELVDYELAFKRIGTYYKTGMGVFRMCKTVRDWLEPHHSSIELGVPEGSIINSRI